LSAALFVILQHSTHIFMIVHPAAAAAAAKAMMAAAAALENVLWRYYSRAADCKNNTVHFAV